MKDNNKQKILVVDDSPENIQVMIEVLKKDYLVHVAISGEKALSILSDDLVPDLILLDVIMPNMDGYELCKILKNNSKFKDIPIIFVTILENEHDIVKGFELGAVDYVVKPIEPIVLKARIDTHLKLKKFQDKLIQDLKERDELLVNQSRLVVLGEMFENITHQWKQPLSAISVSTTGIKLEKEHGMLTEDRLINFIDTIDLSVNHLCQTIDDFKNFLVTDTKKHRFNLKDIVNKTVKLLQIKFKADNILIERDLIDIEITTYQNDLIQVLMNILSNASEALFEKKGEKIIKIEFFRNDKDICLKIEDNAGGIKKEYLEKIFDKYFSTKKDKEGSGVGLYMSKKIVEERLFGKIKAKNTKIGACFTIYLPL
ncbi:MAG: response regulator [Halarcobacter sp.]